MPKQIRKVTYGPNPITTALPYRDVRKALAIAEREGYAKAVKKTKIPERLVRMHCNDAGVKPAVERESDRCFVSYYPGSQWWRFSSEAADMLGVEGGQAVDIEAVSCNAFRLGGKAHYRARVSMQAKGPRFACEPLARKMMVDGAESAVRFYLSPAKTGYLAKRI